MSTETETIFSATVTATSDQGFNNGTTEITSDQATIVGGKMYAISGQTDIKNLIAMKSNVYYFCMTNNNTYFKVELDKALAVGDVITADALGGVKNDLNKGIWVTTAESYPTEAPACAGTSAEESIISGLLNYTVTEGSEYVGKTTLYIYRAAGATEYFNNFKITRTGGDEGGSDEGGSDTPATDMTATWDYGNAGVMEATIALSGSSTAGTVKAIEDNGILLTVEANSATFRNNGNNIQVRKGAIFKVPVKNAGDLVTIKGYPGYSYYKINDSDEIKNTSDNPQTEYKAKASDATQGYVAITSTNDNNYFYSISVTQYAPKGATTLDNESATVTFPFTLGTEGQKATFSNADYWLGSKVELGNNMGYAQTRTLGDATFTKIQP